MTAFALSAAVSWPCAVSAAAPEQSDLATLERIRARGAVRCGAVERPGLAESDGQGHWRGLEVDICRAVATAVLGTPEQIEFQGYASPAQFDRVRLHADDIAFLSGGEIATHQLAGSVVPGPTVYVVQVAAMVPNDSHVRSLSDLAGKGICFMIAGPAESGLSDYFEAADTTFLRHPYSESGEMDDAYAVQRCQALAGETTQLAKTRTLRSQAALRSRLLPQSVNTFPIVATTGVDDAKWAAAVAWVVDTLISAERPQRKWFAGGADAMPVAAPGLGLAQGWQRRVIEATGHYGDVFERNLGSGSPYRLPTGPNANHMRAGALLAPFVE